MPTPVQRQYQHLKSQCPDAILFFQLGDFYELFYEDALVGSKVLGLILTARHKNTENEMPMCGFPCHSYQEYLTKLLKAGYKVAIADQITKENSITRKITRIITPGTTLEEGSLSEDKHNFLLALYPEGKNPAIAYTDISTGNFRVAVFPDKKSFFEEIHNISPAEILLPPHLFEDETFCAKLPKALYTPRKYPSEKKAKSLLSQHFPPNHLSVCQMDTLTNLLIPAAQLLQYIEETQKTKLSHIREITRYTPERFMHLDPQTYRHLEIFQSQNPSNPQSSLWGILEKGTTALGNRNLRWWLTQPLKDLHEIQKRQEAIAALIATPSLMEELWKALKHITDIERLLARLSSQKGNARDLAFLRESLKQFPVIKSLLTQWNCLYSETLQQQLPLLESLCHTLSQALVESPPTEITTGGMIKPGFDAELESWRKLAKESQIWLENFLEKAKKESGINSLKIKYSKNFGFFLEVTKANLHLVPKHWIRRQTLVGSERYTTPELSEYEEKILQAESKCFEREYELFLMLREQTLSALPELQKAAKAIATIDTLLSLARSARKYHWCQPKMQDSSTGLFIQEGRHPIVEAFSSTPFVPNDLHMDEEQYFHLITGPNMAGKSTFLRQNALIIFLAHIGSFVPAKKAVIPLTDRIFTRIGASDDLSQGKSTFFVEMTECASILHAATEKSFIILDEIGRGTSTFDGISLAWAITEHLHDHLKAKTLFATHYHELIDLAEKLPHARNFHVEVSQDRKGIIFLHTIKPGGVADSFGIEVARLAGIPESIIQRARKILARLESESLNNTLQPSLFSFSASPSSTISTPKVLKTLKELNPDELSPRQALETLYQLKKELTEDESS